MATISSREFNHDVGRAKREARIEPVIITDRGVPAYVLVTIDEYRRLKGEQRTLVDMIRMDADLDVEIALPQRGMLDDSGIPEFED